MHISSMIGKLICILSMSVLLTACGSISQKSVTVDNRAAAAESGSINTETETDMNTETETETETETVESEQEEIMKQSVILKVNDEELIVAMENNSSAEALMDLLKDGDIIVDMSDYANMEKVGSLGTSLPTNNRQITTSAGDVILYQGSQLVIYYAPNSWNFTKLGRIQNVNAAQLRQILGNGDVEITLSLQ